MNKPIIAITGATGFIGGLLTIHLKKMGYYTIALVRKKGNSIADEEREYDLQTPPSRELLNNIDIVIHCAFDKNDSSAGAEVNFNAALRLFQLAGQSGVKKIIFFSSIAAQPGILSAYGKNKLAIESLLDPARDVIVKPGLVIGNGGLFGRILQTTLSKKMVPVIDKGNQSMQVLAANDLLIAITTIIEKDLHGSFVLTNRERLTYKQLFLQIGKTWQKKLFYIPVNKRILNGLISIAGSIRIILPVTKENLLGLVSQQYEDPGHSLALLDINPSSLEQALIELKEH